MLDSYRAETDRMKALAASDPEAFRPVIRQLIGDALGIDLNSVMARQAFGDALRGAMPGAVNGALSPQVQATA
jgi:predicted negative regulator of RcsB-dependent stress response